MNFNLDPAKQVPEFMFSCKVQMINHLKEHKFKHSFQDSLNSFCSCGKGEVETSSHYLLHCSNYLGEPWLSWALQKILTCLYYSKGIRNLLVFYSSAAHLLTKTKILLSLMPLMTFTILTGKFGEPLFNSSWVDKNIAFLSIAL